MTENAPSTSSIEAKKQKQRPSSYQKDQGQDDEKSY